MLRGRQQNREGAHSAPSRALSLFYSASSSLVLLWQGPHALQEATEGRKDSVSVPGLREVQFVLIGEEGMAKQAS